MYNQSEVITDLKENVAEITFKAQRNGSLRNVRCTLMQSMLPPNYNEEHLDKLHSMEENLNTVTAWDMRSQKWVAFDVTTIQWIQLIDNL